MKKPRCPVQSSVLGNIINIIHAYVAPEFATRGRHGEARPARPPKARAPLGAGPHKCKTIMDP